MTERQAEENISYAHLDGVYLLDLQSNKNSNSYHKTLVMCDSKLFRLTMLPRISPYILEKMVLKMSP